MAANQLIKQPYAFLSSVGLQRRIRQMRCEINRIVKRAGGGHGGRRVGFRCEQCQRSRVHVDGEIPRSNAIRPEVKLDHETRRTNKCWTSPRCHNQTLSVTDLIALQLTGGS